MSDHLCIYDGGAACPTCRQPWPADLVLPVWRRCLPPCRCKGERLGTFRVACCGGQGTTRIPIYGCSRMGTCTERPTPAEAETYVALAADHRACLGCPQRQS